MNEPMIFDFKIDANKVKAEVTAKLQATVTDEFNKVASNLLADDKYHGTRLGPVRANIRKHVETLVLEKMTDEQVQAFVQKKFDETYDAEFQKAVNEAILRTARKQAQRAVKKMRRTEHEERSPAKV